METGVLDFGPAELKQKLDGAEPLFLLDLRGREEFAAWRIEASAPMESLNVPYTEIIEAAESEDPLEIFTAYAEKHLVQRLPRERFVAVVCARGGTSAFLAEALRNLGYRAASLQGGMPAWGDYYEVRPVLTAPELSIHQVIRPARGCLSYVVASKGEAVVIDPLRHTQHYLDLVGAAGLKVVAVLDTHVHADHISGGPALAQALATPYFVHPYDAIHPVDLLPAAMAYEPLREGQSWRFGSAEIRALHVPGHTLGNTVYLLNDRYLFSGDSIFVDSIARPDLGGRGESWTPLHHRSLSRLLALGDAVLVLPGHFSRPEEAGEEGLFAATLGELRRSNEGLRMVQAGAETFRSYILGSLPTFPPQYVEIKRVNVGLVTPDEEKASELELGRNICALAQAYDSSHYTLPSIVEEEVEA